jgi:membrane dipeptidase
MALEIHNNAVTIDSHTDTPLHFTDEFFEFDKRHNPEAERSKVDLPRMEEGGLDGIFLAIFIGQGERTDDGNRDALREAILIFDSIDVQLNRYSDKMSLAVNSEDINKILTEGKKAIFLGLENAYPIGNDISLADSFYNRGARYITLCHTKNNDVCDSSTDEIEHGGLSEFGKKLVEHMGEIGMITDISHISDESVRDVLEISPVPVIASHSCARAICDNPRNLSDELLRKIADKGGVIQLCILSDYIKAAVPFPERDSAKAAVVAKHGDYYSLDESSRGAFLADWFAVDKVFPPKLATVSDAVDHIDHIVKVAGIDHVGIGTDFDGGGGVKGCYDVSELPNITIELVKRGYSESDIRKIWSGNLLRVMLAAESAVGSRQ